MTSARNLMVKSPLSEVSWFNDGYRTGYSLNQANSCVFDPSAKILYVAGAETSNNSSTNPQACYRKLNRFGNELSSTSLLDAYGPSTNSSAKGIDFDGTYIYASGNASRLNGNVYIAKHTTGLGLVWCVSVSGDNTTNKMIGFGSIVADSSGNSYTSAYVSSISARLFKHDSSGNLLWQRAVTSSTAGFTRIYGLVLDSTGSNIYAAMSVPSASGTNSFGVVKIDSSGSVVWSRVYYGTVSSGNNSANAISRDSSDNIYVAGQAPDTYTSAYLVKINSSGTLLWQRKYVVAGGSWYNAVSVGSDGYIYAAGSQHAKFDSSGNLIWMRDVSATKNAQWFGVRFNGIAYGAGDVYMVSNEDVTFGDKIMKYPADGSLVGTYNNYIQITSVAGPVTTGSLSLTGATISTSATSHATGGNLLSAAGSPSTMTRYLLR